MALLAQVAAGVEDGGVRRPSLLDGAHRLQQRHGTRGDARAALAQSKYVVTQSYRTPFTEHAFLEPECAVAFPYKDGVKVYTSDQGVYDTRKEISIMLGWEPERIVVENKLVGGGFAFTGRPTLRAASTARCCTDTSSRWAAR